MPQPNNLLPLWRTRLAVGLASCAAIGLELALMRLLALRFWQHFAYMIISVALLGFGASGTAIALLRARILRRHRAWLYGLALAFPVSISLIYGIVAQRLPVRVEFLAWSRSEDLLNLLALELLMFLPFFFAGGVVGVALMDHPGRVSGHYAANLVGSGIGAMAAVLLMHVLSIHGLVLAMAGAGFLAAVLLAEWRRLAWAVPSIAAGLGIVLLAIAAPGSPAMSEYKTLSLARMLSGTKVLYSAEGPLGRVDAVESPALHQNPGLSLQYVSPLPFQRFILLDGDQASSVYDCRKTADWSFLDYTTRAAAYRLATSPKTLVIGAGGGEDIGLALYHRSAEVVALEMNPLVVKAMNGPLAGRGGEIYRAPGVRLLNQEARGYLAGTTEKFDLIQLPAVDALGASGAGLYSTQESYLYTVEAFTAMLDHLKEGGVLCATRWVRTPPRDELRVFEIARAALERKGLDPRPRLAMIRNYLTATVLACRRPLSAEAIGRLRTFCEDRGFDICYLPGGRESEANRFHILDRPYYFEGTRALLGPERDDFLRRYIYDLSPTTDDKPYYFHFFRWRALPVLVRQLGGQTPAFLEVGYLMLVAALIQALALSIIFILMPLAPGIPALRTLSPQDERAIRRTPGKPALRVAGKSATFGYFLLIGVGFMLLEMAFLQKLILHLANPIYSAAVVISGFLVFAGIGSHVSRIWRAPPGRVAAHAAGAVVCAALVYAWLLDPWLSLTQGQAAWARFMVAVATIAPPAIAMGHMFPCALRQIGLTGPTLVPWAWAVNGCASVIATVAAPLLAMRIGFSNVVLIAAGCYGIAGLLTRYWRTPEIAPPVVGIAS